MRQAFLAVSLAVLLSACSEVEWCDSEAGKALHARHASASPYKTVHDLYTMTDDSLVAMFAHRGGYTCSEQDGAPENSLANVEKAVRMGFDGYETDLWATADGEFIIHHDDTLDRTTTGTGPVTEVTLADARKLNLRYPSGQVTDELIPTLRELLLAGQGRILFLIELKGGSAERFADLIEIARETGSIDHVLYWIDWSPEYAEIFEGLLNSGMQEVRTNVIWRARSPEALEDIVQRFDPMMVDVVPSYFELRWERRLEILPREHIALVDVAQKHGVEVLVSKVATNSFLDVLLEKNVKAYMSRAPEVELDYLIKEGMHH